jgi:arginine-tRNA-protein transferase
LDPEGLLKTCLAGSKALVLVDPLSDPVSLLGYSYYASTTSLSPSLYQKLVGRCWRRSGTLLYRPNQKQSCCPHYTLRLDSHSFKPTKDQRQTVNRFNKYVLGDEYIKEATRLYPRSREEARKRDNDFDLVQRIREVESPQIKRPPEPAHEFVVTLEPDTFTEEKYAVFENYQQVVHHEPPSRISRQGFTGFLCNSPLQRGVLPGIEGKEGRQLGSFHQCYRLDGRLVAIGVLDLLPDCVSAVYFLYHESIHMHNPGKLGALREISLAMDQGYRWWYPGYYIHSCPKMRYKIDYSPQYVLDPETLDWNILDKEALAIFDKKKYVSLSQERDAKKEEGKVEAVPIKADSSPDPEDDATSDVEEASDDDEEETEFLLMSNMPGIPSLEHMNGVDMDNIAFCTNNRPGRFVLSDLVWWEADKVSHYGSMKSRIAELVAAVGPDLMDQVCLDFRHRDRS